MARNKDRELNAWLKHHGYGHAQQKAPYTPSSRMAHARVIHQEPTGREVYAQKERDHHITTFGRRALSAEQFALPPGPEEKRRGIKGRLPIDTLKRGRNALGRAKQMKMRGEISAGQLDAVKRKVHAAWPSIDIEVHATMKETLYIVTVPPTAEVGSYKTRARGPIANARRDALWDYNSARRHDGLPPVDRMPRGTKYTKEG